MKLYPIDKIGSNYEFRVEEFEDHEKALKTSLIIQLCIGNFTVTSCLTGNSVKVSSDNATYICQAWQKAYAFIIEHDPEYADIKRK